eukprot:5047736-Prymnesium_polylepis.1
MTSIDSEGIALRWATELSNSIRDPTPPNSLVQTSSSVIRAAMTILQRNTLPEPITALRYAIRQSVRGQTEQLLFQQQ